MSDEIKKFCVDCAHCLRVGMADYPLYYCNCPQYATRDLVTGETLQSLCHVMRDNSNGCGYHANWFMPKGGECK